MRIDRLVPLAVVASRIAALTSACAKRNGGAYCVETLAAGEPISTPTGITFGPDDRLSGASVQVARSRVLRNPRFSSLVPPIATSR